MAKKKRTPISVWIVVGLLFVGLLGFGASGLSGTIRSVGTVGAKDIPVTLYQRELNTQIRAYEAQIGTPVSFPQAQQIGLDQAVLNQVVNTRTLDNEATRLGLSVGDERVRTEVLRIPTFQGLDGKFDREAYRFSLSQSGMSETQFENGIREEIARTILQGAVVGGVAAPDAYAQTLVAYIGEARDLTYAFVGADALTAPVPGPTDAAIQAYYDANPEPFTAPETRAINYVWLTPDMIMDQVTVDAEAVRALYDERIDEFMRPERRLVERLVFSDQATADAAMARVTAGEIDFDALVAERGLTLGDVDMGDVDAATLGDAGDAVFAANPGDVVGPLPSSFGPALFRMNAVLAAEETPFEEAEPDLRAELAADRARRVIDDSIDGIKDLLAGGASLLDLADRTDLELGQIDWTADSDADIAGYEEFRTAAAAATEGAFPDIITLADGGIFALELTGITAPTLRPLADVRDDVIAAWTADKTQEAVMAQATEISASILPLTGFDTLGLTAQQSPNTTRRSFVAGTPPGFIADVFDMALGEVAVIDAAPNAIIVRVDKIADPDMADARTAADLEQVKSTAAAGIAQDMFNAFNLQLRQRTDITLNQAAINAVHAQIQ